MEIQDIRSSLRFQGPGNEKLTEEQKAELKEILAKYDPENFSKQDRVNLSAELQEAGIPKCRDAFLILKDAGFNPPQPGGGPEKPGPPPLGQAVGRNSSLMDMIEKMRSGEISKEEFQEFVRDLAAKGEETSGMLVNESV